MVVAIVNRIVAEDEEVFDRIIERFKNRARLVDRMPGFMGIELFVNRERREVLVITRWRSREDMERWLESAEFRMAHRGGGSRASSEGIVYEVIEV
ncbi:MAG: antibiotic biosynthesis monooxygenase [Desulfurococcales archaeon]|nr:antibiotic biosynthesis monooxygenase [Desulfurococcales archaeon]